MKTKILIPLSLINLAVGLIALVLASISPNKLLWIGAAIATGAGPIYLMVVVGSGRLARTSAKLPVVQSITIVGLFIAVYAFFGMEQTDWRALAASFCGVGFVQWYVRVFSSYKRKKSQNIVNGEPLPDLPLERLDGTSITTSSLVGKKTLLVFFRGNWCPLCTAQLKEIWARADRLSALGVTVRFISNQAPEKSRELTGKLELSGDFEILFDRELRAAKGLAIEDIDGAPLGIVGYPRDTVMATVIALDQKGRVIFGDETDNYRVRPHPDIFLKVFES